jgi:hypothetical protein
MRIARRDIFPTMTQVAPATTTAHAVKVVGGLSQSSLAR